jgi:uncharacterized protein
MFMMDPSYLLLTLVGAALSFLPQMWVKNTYAKFAEVPTRRGQTGAQLAQQILKDNGVHNVQVEAVAGELSDHYDPGALRVRLSEANYYGTSVAGVAVAAHECGHAIQHATGYYPVVLRSALVPAVNIGSQFGPMLFMISMGLGVVSHGMPGWALLLAWVGVLLFGFSVLFHMVTLPVELNASARALKILSDGRYLETDEMPGAKKVLTAAAFTYVAAALYSLIQLWYYVSRLMGSGRRDE